MGKITRPRPAFRVSLTHVVILLRPLTAHTHLHPNDHRDSLTRLKREEIHTRRLAWAVPQNMHTIFLCRQRKQIPLHLSSSFF